MGVELELGVLLLIQLLGTSLFGKFEVETPVFRKIFKWLLIDGITLALYYWINHFSLLVPALMLMVGTFVHFRTCLKNGINPLDATPRKKYYALRGWPWKE